MRKSILTTATLSLVLACSSAVMAQRGPAPKHGGQTAVVAGHHDAELVVSPTALTLYLTNHGKPLVPADNAIKATIQIGAKKLVLSMRAEGDHAVAALPEPLPKGAIIVLTGRISGGHGMTARFVVK